MVVTRNMKRAIESPMTDPTTKRQKLPVRSKDAESTPTKAPATRDESARSSAKKRASFVVELRSEASPSKGDDVQEEQVITGVEQPAPEPEREEKVINDSEASPESGNEAQQGEAPEAEPPAQPVEENAAPAAEAGDDSDSDEAPEAVSTSTAAAQAKKSVQAANKAIAEQAAAQKRKRQERNSRLQEQAAARKAQKAAEEPKEEGEEEQLQPKAALAEGGRQKPNKRDIPAELPAEFLESDSEDEGEGEGEGAERKRRKARKLHTAEAQIARESRGPRDEVVGSTVFRVVKKEDERLAPKARKYSINAKKALLVRGRTPVKARKGFLV